MLDLIDKLSFLSGKIRDNKHEYNDVKDLFVMNISSKGFASYQEGIKMFALIEKQNFLLAVSSIYPFLKLRECRLFFMRIHKMIIF